VYILPQLATAKQFNKKKCFLEFYKLVLPTFIVVMVVLYWHDFTSLIFFLIPAFRLLWRAVLAIILEIFSYCCYLILGCQFSLKKVTVAFLLRVFFLIYDVFLSILKKYGIEGVVIAQAHNIIYFILLLLVHF
jgi:hypothetical protein